MVWTQFDGTGHTHWEPVTDWSLNESRPASMSVAEQGPLLVVSMLALSKSSTWWLLANWFGSMSSNVPWFPIYRKGQVQMIDYSDWSKAVLVVKSGSVCVFTCKEAK